MTGLKRVAIVDPSFQTVTQMVACCKKEQVMSESKRKNFTDEFKAKVALEAIRGVKTVNQIGQEFGVHPTQVGIPLCQTSCRL